MSQSLITGASGLRAHQQQLDVVANNLANLNTIGFKSQRLLFSDLMYNTIKNGAASENDKIGGTNPQQVGTGVGIAQINRRFTQGTLQSTGELLDFAIGGEGFFVLTDQSGQNVYTRAGSFGLDAAGRLVDPSTGFLVQRNGILGENTDTEFGFQVPGDNSIKVPLGSPVPGQISTQIEFIGNLPTSAIPPRAEVLVSGQNFLTPTGPATATTLLNDLNSNSVDYVAGDFIELSGTDIEGTPFDIQLPADTTTMGDIVNALNANLTDAEASLGTDGSLNIIADETGEAFLSLTMRDASGNTGETTLDIYAMLVETDGKDGDKFDTTVQVFDIRGEGHSLQFEFEKVTNNSWDITATVNDSTGNVIDGQVLGLRFNEDGTFSTVGEDGLGDASIEVIFDTIETTTPIVIGFEEISHLATEFSLSHSQDGSPPGSLVSIVASDEGELRGIASNGKNFPLAQMAIATFANLGALEGFGQNYFTETLNSGNAQLGAGLSGGRGRILGNQLESSNVDISQEFTRLIVAQRGFSANARTITVASDILEELTNIIR